MSLERRCIRSWLAGGCLVVTLLLGGAFHGWADPGGMADLAGPLKALAAQGGGVSTLSANRLGLVMRGGAVQVEVLFRSPADAAGTGLGRYGCVEQLRRGSRVQAFVPVTRLAALAALPQVAQIRPTERMTPLQGLGAANSEGVQLTDATAMHLAGINGKNAKVAVVDVGFAGLNAAEVPTGTPAPVSFPAGYVGASSHGSAVAEVVADMAPQCSLTLIQVDSALAAESAVDYIIQQKIQIAVMALGTIEGPFDGTHPLSLKVNSARAAGVFWVNAAGNFAQRHWDGLWSDNNSDEYLEFTSGGKDFIGLDLPAGTFDTTISWFDTAGPTTDRDYDLVLTTDATSGQIVARSAITQNGDDPPRENLRAFIATAGRYRLRVQRVDTGGTDFPDRFHLYTPAVDLETSVQVKDNSLAIPAEASGAFAVGATRGSANPTTGPLAGIAIDKIEPFSSRGEVGDDSKPALVAPDSVVTSFASGPAAVDGLNPFLGTSAAAAHVAGAAALLYSEDQSRSARVLGELLVTLAFKYTNLPVDDVNAYGQGRLRLRVGASSDGNAPVIVIEYPRNNDTIGVTAPVLVATLTDDGTVDPSSIQAFLDGVQVVEDGSLVSGSGASDFSFDDSTGTLRLSLSDLSRAQHSVRLQAADLVGNQSLPTTTNFRVTTPSLAAGLHMISLPYPGLANSTPAEVFGLADDEIGLARWVPTDSRTNKYHVYPDDFASFSPPDAPVSKPPAGLGYFLRLARTATLSLGSASLSDETYQISLTYGTEAPKGWNMIGNPYNVSVDWGSVEFVSNNGRQDLREAIDPSKSPVTEGVLFRFVSSESGGFYSFSPDPTQEVMAPLAGYWLHVLKDATLIVHNPGGLGATAAPRPAAKPVAVSADNWLLQLEARAGKYEDPINYVGVSARASDAYDAGVDVSEPPPLVDTLRMYVPKRDWGQFSGSYAKDVRGSLSGKQEWDVEVSCRLKDVPVTVSWPGLNASVPKDVELRLVDLDSGAKVYMRTSSGYTFRLSEPGVRRLRIVASRAGASALTVNSLQASQSGSGGVVLTYSVSRDAEVGIEVRNIAGVLIRALPAGHVSAGASQSVAWNGVSDRGGRAPAGKYFARVTARAADGQVVQALRPFTVGR